MNSNVTQETLELFKQALSPDNNDPSLLAKAGWIQPSGATTGLQGYMLDAPSKKLVPFLSPLRNKIPREGGGYSIQANWRAITVVNNANVPATVPEGKRGGVVTATEVDYLAAFRGIGLEDNVTFEAEYAGRTFEDVRATATELLLQTLMCFGEEPLLLAGQGTWSLGTTPTPVGTLVIGAGSMTAQAGNLGFVVALTYDGYTRATVAGGVADTVTLNYAGPYGGSTSINAGHAAMSAASNAITTTGANLAISYTVTAVPGAYAYAWYVGLAIGSAALAAITTVNAVTISANPAGSQFANAAGLSSDKSANALAFDGITTIAAKTGSNAYYKSLNGAPLTFDGAGGCIEVDNMLISFYGTAASGNLRLSPTDLWLSPNDILKFSKGVLTGAPGSLQAIWKINVAEGVGEVQAGGMIATSYLNKITGSRIELHVHPNLPSGKIVATTSTLPYKLSNVTNVMRVLTRSEYMSWAWPVVQRQYEYGVYADEVLQHYFPPSLGILDNGILT